MATIDMLERLRMIQRSFSTSKSLEATVAMERIELVINRTEQIIRQRAFLRDERRRLRLSCEKLNRQLNDQAMMAQTDYIPPGFARHDPSDHHVFLNVGGMMFEAPMSILGRDENSLLAQLLTPLSPVTADDEGVFYFNRDWWFFRYILIFLRDGTLPDDRRLLALLYKEASFWKLRQLQKAIEEEKLNLVPPKGSQAELDSMTEAERKRWWRQNVNSFSQQIEEAAPPPPQEDWWIGTEYKGKKFGPLSTDPEKVITEGGAPDESAMLSVTWSRTA